MEFRGYNPTLTDNTLVTDNTNVNASAATDSCKQGGGVVVVPPVTEKDIKSLPLGTEVVEIASSSSSSDGGEGTASDEEESDDDDEPSVVHPNVQRGIYPLYFIHTGGNAASANPIGSATSAATGVVATLSASKPSPTAAIRSEQRRVPLELEFIGTCFAVAPKIVMTTAHHYNSRNDDVGRFGILVECPKKIENALRAQQKEGKHERPKPQQPLSDSARSKSSGKRKGGSGGNQREKQSTRAKGPMSAALRKAAAAEASPTNTPPTPNAPTVLFANERVFLLIPCRYGAKAPTGIDWFKPNDESEEDKMKKPQQQTAASKGSKGTKKDAEKKSGKAVEAAANSANASAINNAPKVSPDVATFWLESPLPYYVPCPEHFGACSPMEGAGVTTVYYEPPKVRFSVNAVGTHMRQRPDQQKVAKGGAEGSPAARGDCSDAFETTSYSLFGRALKVQTADGAVDAKTIPSDPPPQATVVPTPRISECLFVADKAKAVAVMRAIVLTTRSRPIPRLAFSSGEVIGGIACDGFYREAHHMHQQQMLIGSDGTTRKDDTAAAETPKSDDPLLAAKLERRRRAMINLDDDDDNWGRQTNSNRGVAPPLGGGGMPPALSSGSSSRGFMGASSSLHVSVHVDDSDDDAAVNLSSTSGATTATRNDPNQVRVNFTRPSFAGGSYQALADRFQRVVPATFRPPSAFVHGHTFSFALGEKRERSEEDEIDEMDKNVVDLDDDATQEELSPTSAAAAALIPSPFPEPLTLSNAPVVWWHSCLTKDTVTPYGSSGGVVVDSASNGQFIVGMHVATNNLFTYYRYYRPRQERILRALYVKHRTKALLREKKEAVGEAPKEVNAEENELKKEAATTDVVVKKEEKDAEEGAVLSPIDAELLRLSTMLRDAPPIPAVPPKGVEDTRIAEFLTSKTLVQSLIAMQVYLNTPQQ